jgi:hypothetical protein
MLVAFFLVGDDKISALGCEEWLGRSGSGSIYVSIGADLAVLFCDVTLIGALATKGGRERAVR